MVKKNSKLDTKIEEFNKNISDVFGKDVVSVIQFGSSLTTDYVEGKSAIRFLVVLTQAGIQQIDKTRNLIRKWQTRQIDLPLFLTESYIQASLDSYPVEFLDMKNTYMVVSGKDVLADLEFAVTDVRLQSEREAKGYLLKLRQGFIQTSGSKKQLKNLISESLNAFSMLFKAMLFIDGKKIPQLRGDLFRQACDTYNLDNQLFNELGAVSGNREKRSGAELDDLMRNYINEVKKISEILDKMDVK